MYATSSSNKISVYGLTSKARALAPQLAHQENARFLVGTTNLRDENEVHLIEVNDEETDVKCIGIFNHLSEVWSIEPSPTDPNLFFTVYNQLGTENAQRTTQFKASLWRLDIEDSSIAEVFELPGHTGEIRRVLWNPADSADTSSHTAVSLDESTIRIWKIGQSEAQQLSFHSVGETRKLTAGVYSPLHADQVATASETSIRGWDLRNLKKETFCINQAHTFMVRDIDYNPNKDYHIVSGGDDGRVKFWDSRKPDVPLRVFGGHSHWVWSVRYNRQHDQLVLSGGSDAKVKLWHAVTISSSPPTEESTNRTDQLIHTYSDHEDSVYSVAWGTSPFVFAALSYDGRVVVSTVPREYADLATM